MTLANLSSLGNFVGALAMAIWLVYLSLQTKHAERADGATMKPQCRNAT